MERSASRQPERPALELLVDDDPGACSVPPGGGWRPGARWAREGMPSHRQIEAQIASFPTHAQPPMRELGRRSEAASHPYKASTAAPRVNAPTSAPSDRAPLALIGKVGRREEVVAACDGARALGVHPGMAATHARALISDLDFRPAEPEADAALLDRLALFAVRRWSPIAAVSPSDGLWIDLAGCAYLHGGEEKFCRRLLAFCRRAGFTARVAVDWMFRLKAIPPRVYRLHPHVMTMIILHRKQGQRTVVFNDLQSGDSEADRSRTRSAGSRA